MAIQSNFPAIKPSLLLDFANTKTLDPRITFTRASTASYYDGVTTAMAEQNLFTYSQDFDDASWSKFGASVTANATTAPDGTTTADSLVSTATPASVYLTRTPTFTASQPYVMSFYVKANTANFIQIITASAIVPSGYVNFNVTSGAGAIGNYGGTGITPSIVDVGNGWYRCVLTIASVAGSGAIEFHLVDSATAARSATYSGTIGTGVYLWGAQLENRSAISAYTATTTQAITNYIPKLQSAASGVARFDNNPTTGESLGLLIEEQRTNLLTYSEQFDNAAWSKINSCTITTNTIVSPDGTLTGDKLVRDSAASSYRVQQLTSVTSGTAYTFSCYAKASQLSWIAIGSQTNFPTNTHAFFNLSSGVLGTIGSGATSASITLVGNGWYRCSVTATANATGTSAFQGWLAPSDNTFTFTSGNTFDGVFLWGAQFEAGAFATSYIATTSSQVTRSADAASLTGTNFSSWYNAAEGTLYGEAKLLASAGGSSYPGFAKIFTDSGNKIGFYTNPAGSLIDFSIAANSAGSADLPISQSPVSGYVKVAGAYRVNDFAVSANASAVSTDASGLVPAVNQMNICAYDNAWNGTIKKIAYYPLRVTNAQLQALTS